MNAPNQNAVLVIDPDPSIRALIVALLRRKGYVAQAAASADQALQLHRDGRHAAVIVEPRIHGGDALLDALPPQNLIVVTTPEPSQATYAGRPGVHAVLFKPFFLNDLTEAVAACCGEAS